MLRFSKRSRLTFSSIPDDARSEESSGTRRRDSDSHARTVSPSSPSGTTPATAPGTGSSLWATRQAPPTAPPTGGTASRKLPAVPARKANPPPLPRTASGRTSLPAVPAPSLPPPPLPSRVSRASSVALPKVSAPAPRPNPRTDRSAESTESPAEPSVGRARPGWGYSLALVAVGVVAGISASSAISHFSALRRSVPAEAPVVVTSLEVPGQAADPPRTDMPSAPPAAELRFDTPLDIVVPAPAPAPVAAAVAPIAAASPRPASSGAPAAARTVGREVAPLPSASPKSGEASRARVDKYPESLPSPAASMSPAAVDALVRERLRTSLR